MGEHRQVEGGKNSLQRGEKIFLYRKGQRSLWNPGGGKKRLGVVTAEEDYWQKKMGPCRKKDSSRKGGKRTAMEEKRKGGKGEKFEGRR